MMFSKSKWFKHRLHAVQTNPNNVVSCYAEDWILKSSIGLQGNKLVGKEDKWVNM